VLSQQGGSALVSAIRIGAGFWIEDIYCVDHLLIHSDYLPSLFSNYPSTQSEYLTFPFTAGIWVAA
jgi:hypothetical protein